MSGIWSIQDSSFDEMYEHQKTLGIGGQGRADLVLSKSTNKIVVIKTSKCQGNIVNEPEVRMMKILSDLSKAGKHNDNILYMEHIWDMSQTNTPCYKIALPFLPSGDLRKWREGNMRMVQKLPEAFLFHIYIELSDALNYLHENGISHRDLKPENVMIDPRPFVFGQRTQDRKIYFDGIKIIDFGIADTRTDTHEFRGGTPKWCPPLYLGQNTAGAKADVWAAGAVMHFLATGLSVKPEKIPDEVIKNGRDAILSWYHRDAPVTIERLVNDPTDYGYSPMTVSLEDAREMTYSAPQPMPTRMYSVLFEHYIYRALNHSPEIRPSAATMLANLLQDGNRQIDLYMKWVADNEINQRGRPLIGYVWPEPPAHWTP